MTNKSALGNSNVGSGQSISRSPTPDAHPDEVEKKVRVTPIRTAFFGTSGSFSHRVLQRIKPRHINLQAIFCDASEPFHPSLGFDIHKLDPPPPLGPESEELRLHTSSDLPTRTIIDIGWQLDIPVYSIGRIGSDAVVETLDAYKVDVVFVACFNKRIPASLLAVPRLGFLNLHPSMLPDYRGPEPIQWILHDGAQGGVTIHWMDENFDTGDIAIQETVDLRPKMGYFEAERFCAEVGANLYLEIMIELLKGNVPRRPQGDGGFYRGRLGRAIW